jgi:diguanylate cyclase (GGDEF)-like protein
MKLLKAVAVLPGGLLALRRRSITATIAFVVTVTGLVVWLALDQVYRQGMQEAVAAERQQQWLGEARNQRARLRESLRSFADTARYLANYRPLQRHLQMLRTGAGRTGRPEVHAWQPDWAARAESLDGRITLDYLVLMDAAHRPRAVFQQVTEPLPQVLVRTGDGFLGGAVQQPRIRLVEATPYLIAAYPVREPGQTADELVVIASRIDAGFLAGVLGESPPGRVSGLLLGSEQRPVALHQAHAERENTRNAVRPTDRMTLIANELLLEDGRGMQLRHALWADGEGIGASGEQLLAFARQQRTLVILMFAALFCLAAAWISRRVRKISHSVDYYARRLGIVLPRSRKGDPIDCLRKRLERLSEEVIAETSALEYQAQHDNLTNLPNRSLLLERLESELQTAHDSNEPLALFVMDLDQFKEVNDTLGHHIGDRLLQEVGRRLVSVLRRTDTVSRLGGDEFAVLLPGANFQRSKAVCRKILQTMDRPIKVDNFRLRSGISIGVALCPEHGRDASLLMQHADVAMYEAKRGSKGFAFYTADRDDHSVSRLGISGELRDAIERDELSLEYQPMVDIKTGEIFCAEALVRWLHPEYGNIAPEEFVPLAEQTGVIRPLTLWVMDKALAQTAMWRRVGIDLCISLNLSVRSLQDRKLPAHVQRMVDKHKVDPKNVILEITESAIMSDPMTARRVMRRLSNMGFQLSIDDFGTGYSSLAYLKQLPVDEIKIDKSFVTQMDQDENDAVIVRATIDLAHNLGLKVTAEGVESTDVWDLLEMLGCDSAQGYFIRKPQSPQELANWIRSKEWKHARWVTPLRMAR